jgi:predicted naringenin-chalcone synthase
MAWSIGDRGFDIALSSYVPKIIGANIREFIEPSLAASGLASTDVETWAVHPGGRAIIDQVQRSLDLGPEQVSASREVLRDYGNMSRRPFSSSSEHSGAPVPQRGERSAPWRSARD